MVFMMLRSTTSRLFALAVIAALGFALLPPAAAPTFPELTGRVVDDHAPGELGKGRSRGGRQKREAERGYDRQREEARRGRAQHHENHDALAWRQRGWRTLELHLGVLRRLLRNREVLHRFGVRIEQRTPPTAGDGAKLRVVVLDRGDVVAPGNGDTVLRTFAVSYTHLRAHETVLD